MTVGVTKRWHLRDIGVVDSKGQRGNEVWLEQKKTRMTLPNVFWVIEVNM